MRHTDFVMQTEKYRFSAENRYFYMPYFIFILFSFFVIGPNSTNKNTAVAPPPVRFTGNPAASVATRAVLVGAVYINRPLKSSMGPAKNT